jgi:pyruvate/2-oxoglutarate dehydrogenase complex dihydrolipoamide acyltransferase (E2) component
MKMENEIKSAFDGVVTKIHVAVGDLVDSERPLVEVKGRAFAAEADPLGKPGAPAAVEKK